MAKKQARRSRTDLPCRTTNTAGVRRQPLARASLQAGCRPGPRRCCSPSYAVACAVAALWAAQSRDGRRGSAPAVGGVCPAVVGRLLRRPVVRARAPRGLLFAPSGETFHRRLANKGRILWGLRKMPTAPGSLGVPFLGHTFALARGVTRYPCTWDLFSIWSRATAPVRGCFAWTHLPPLLKAAAAGACAGADLHRAVRRHRRPCAHEARSADQPEKLWQGPGVFLRTVHCASQSRTVLSAARLTRRPTRTHAGHLGHWAGHQRRRVVEQTAHADQLRVARGDPGRYRGYCAACC